MDTKVDTKLVNNIDTNLEIIKSIILDYAKKYNIEIYKIILFGSRARGDYREDSDYDILIITKEKLDDNIKLSFLYNVHLKLVELLNSQIDLLLVDYDEFINKKKYRGFVYYWAEKEGILLE